MLKHCETDIVFREFPDEVTLAVNISNCPHRCKGCHSPHLQTDCGTELTEKELEKQFGRIQ
jgi:anaerobic ribonucleoside-triphosphate reductase activating protein